MSTWGEFVATSAERELGCPGDMMTTTLLEWGVMLEQVRGG